MNDVRKYLISRLKTLNVPVFFEKVPEGTPYPYLVLHIPTEIDQSYREAIQIDIHIWHTDALQCEALTHDVKVLLNCEMHLDANYGLKLYLQTVLRIPDPQVFRRRVRYEGYLYYIN